MHAWPIFWALKTPKKKVPITGESTYANMKSSPRKNHVFLSFFFCPERGRLTDRWEGMTVICLDGSKKMQVSFFSSIFYEMVYEMREEQKEKVGGIFMGKKSLAGGTCWVGELHTTYLLGTRCV